MVTDILHTGGSPDIRKMVKAIPYIIITLLLAAGAVALAETKSNPPPGDCGPVNAYLRGLTFLQESDPRFSSTTPPQPLINAYLDDQTAGLSAEQAAGKLKTLDDSVLYAADGNCDQVSRGDSLLSQVHNTISDRMNP